MPSTVMTAAVLENRSSSAVRSLSAEFETKALLSDPELDVDMPGAQQPAVAAACCASWKQAVGQAGPAMLVAAAVVGPGTVTTACVIGSEYGYRLCWALALACLACGAVQVGCPAVS